MGKTVSPIEPSETMYTLQNGFVNAGFIFFSLAILATLIFGRFVCGWGCHILALQDLCGWLLKENGSSSEAVSIAAAGVCPAHRGAVHVCLARRISTVHATADEPLIPKFTNHLVTTNFWLTFPSVAVAIPFLFICGFMTVYFLGQKGFCTYACPYGGFFGLADKFSPGKIRVTPACNQCGHCTATCTSNVLGARGSEAVRDGGRSGLHEMHGLRQRLPERRALFRFRKTDAVGARNPPSIKRHYSLTWPEEIVGALVFLGSFLAVRGVYALVPFLMALGCAAVTTFLTLKTVAIASREGVILLPVQFEVVRKNAKGGLGICSLRLRMDWLKRALRLGAISRVPRQRRIPKDSVARRTGPGAAQSRPLAHPG